MWGKEISWSGVSWFAEYKVNPSWEKIHSGVSMLYPLFMLIFGVASITDSPSCLPLNTTYAGKLKEVESNYISDYCEEQHDSKESTDALLVLIACRLCMEVIAGLYLEVTSVRDSFKAFSKAEEIFVQHGESKKTPEVLIQTLLDDPESTLRKIVNSVLHHRPGKVFKALLLRDIFLLFGLLTIAVAIWSWASPFPVLKSITCDVSYDFVWSATKTTTFVCELSGASENAKVAIFFFVTLAMDLFVRATSLFHLVKFRLSLAPNRNIDSALCMLFVSVLSIASRGENDQKFPKFIKMIMSSDRDTLFKIRRHIRSVGRNADPLMASFLTRRDGSAGHSSDRLAERQHREESCDDVPLLGREPCHETLLYPPRLGRGAAVIQPGDCDDGEGFPQEPSRDQDSSVQVDSGPDLKSLVDDRRWRWIIFFANKDPEFGTPEVFDVSAPDYQGNSLLYYALNRAQGQSIRLSTATRILRYNGLIWKNGTRMSAEEFIEEQFLNDATYPKRLKDHLLSAVAAREEVGGNHGNTVP